MADFRQVLARSRTRNLAAALVTAALVIVVVQQSWAGTPISTSTIVTFLVTGVALGSIYGVAAQGLVVTYATSGVFNFAQGAIGMFMAFVYWEFRVDIGLPTVVGVVLTVGVAAPLAGIFIERAIMRFLVDSPVVSQLVVTIGLMVGLMGLGASIWNPNTARTIPRFFGDSGFSIGGTFLPYYRVVTIVTGIAIGIGLRFLLHHTRVGVTMRAVVDNRDLTVLNGARPATATMAAWALGSAMAALAGIFLAEELSALDTQTLTLFIVDAFAAGIIAQLRSLPMAYVGGLIIGLALSFQQNFLDWSGRWTSAPSAIPAVILFIAVLFVPDSRIQGRPKPRKVTERIPSFRTAVVGFLVLIIGTGLCAGLLSRSNLREVTLMMLTAFVMLSLVPLTGWANQISLAQITLVGCGAYALIEWGHNGNLIGLLYAALFAIPIGIIMAGPALRLQGIYLALATMAFARMAEFLFFDQPGVFGNGNRQVPHLSLFGHDVSSPFHFLGMSFAQDGGYLVFVSVLFSVVGMIVIWMQRRAFGRRLVAMRDSPAACSMLGMSVTWTKLSVFVVSAAIAGLSGGLFAIYYGSAGTSDFQLVVGLPYLLLLVVGGLSTVGGTIIGGAGLVQFAWLSQAFPTNRFLQWFQRLGPGLLGIGVGRNPEGVWEQNVQAVMKLVNRVRGDERSGMSAHPSAADVRELGDLPLSPRSRRRLDGPVVELREIAVRFGGLQAVRNVSLELMEGQITGLIGPNGAGKTTFFNVATGMQELDNGRILVDGHDVTGARAHRFARLGIARTFQRLEVFGSLSVRDNIRVAAQLHNRRWSHVGQKPEEVTDTIIDHMGLRDVAAVRADLLPTGTARLLEVGRALATQPRVLLLDEPASGLSASETEAFGALLRTLADSGLAILIVEHDMSFIMDLCNSIVVMDAGEVIANGSPVEVQTDPAVLTAYLGTSAEPATAEPTRASAVVIAERAKPAPADDESVVVQLENVCAGYDGIDVLHDVNLQVRRGEVCAVLGPNGAGKSTALRVVSGQVRPTSGDVTIGRTSIAKVSTGRLIRNGLCVVPEGRGVFPNLTVTDNLKMASFVGVSEDEIAESSFARFPILQKRRGQLAGTLSGGEQQMLAMARALAVKPTTLLVDELSMGLAPKIVEELYEVIAQIAREGVTTLVVEQFAAEVLKVADSAALLISGRIAFHGAPSVVGEMMSSAYLSGETVALDRELSGAGG